ncbi:MAG: hemerythrin domain-containing protein [Chloroflexi bacterium]|nr:hemerythrin domain-containing protein [Chloroflexota bacterium]
MDTTREQLNTAQWLEQHKKIHRHLTLLDKVVAGDMDVLDVAYQLEDIMANTGAGRFQELEKLVRSFVRLVKDHVAWEEATLLPEFDRRGATDFSARLITEHREFAAAFTDIRRKMKELQKSGETGGHERLRAEVKDGLHALLARIERHALDEEEAFFLIDHNM